VGAGIADLEDFICEVETLPLGQGERFLEGHGERNMRPSGSAVDELDGSNASLHAKLCVKWDVELHPSTDHTLDDVATTPSTMSP
jgi:hypothetical protein